MKYRADIDILRAISVLVVILFHMGIPGFPGGFVGVDAFFVISGYLITGILIDGKGKLQYNTLDFYERRIRRIFPALMTVMVSTLLFAAFFLDRTQTASASLASFFATIFSSNIFFWRTTNYFSDTGTNPFLHTWSLSVEEQFYIFYPLVLFLICKATRRVFVCIGILTFASFIVCLIATPRWPDASFYLLPTRSWELLAGALLNAPSLSKIRNRNLVRLLQIVGFALLGFATFFYSEKTPFPGWAALPPVLGAALLLWSGNAEGSFFTAIGRWRFPVQLGKISYSAYLWHYPVILFYQYFAGRNRSIFESVGLLVATFALAQFSWKFIEQPFRGKDSLIRSQKGALVLGLSLLVILSASSFLLYRYAVSSWNLSVADRRFLAAEEKAHVDSQLSRQIRLLRHERPYPVIGDTNKSPTWVIWGDSHANSLMPAFDSALLKRGRSAYMFTAGGYLPVLDVELTGQNWNLRGFNRFVMERILEDSHLQTIVIASMWDSYSSLHSDVSALGPTASAQAIRNEALERTVRILHEAGRKVILLEDYPYPDLGEAHANFNGAKFTYLTTRYGIKLKSVLLTREQQLTANRDFHAFLMSLQDSGLAQVVSVGDSLFDQRGHIRIENESGAFFRDGNHLTRIGALHLLPELDRALPE